jgi:CPA1 family monovalent cation:H+ antiporter
MGMDASEIFIGLVIAAAAVAVLSRWLRVQYTLALLLFGLLLGNLGFAPQVPLTSDLILLIFLPPLLFEAAFALDLGLLWSRRRGVLALALIGTLLATLVGGALVYWATPLPWTVALVFGAMIAATDPVAVLATFRGLGADKRLSVLLEGESLFNDGIALSLFLTLVAAVGGGFRLGDAAATFGLSMIGGVVLGLVIGWVGHLAIALVDEPLSEMVVSVAVAYGAFLAGERLHLSGVIATLIAAMTLSRLGRTRGWVFSGGSPEAIDNLWSFLAFIANTALFLLLGLNAPSAGLTTYPYFVAWGIAAALLGRAATAYGLGAVLHRRALRLPWAERHVVFWGGLRGAVALAAALSLPPDFPYRQQLLAMTYGVVLFTVLAQGLTIGPLVRRLGLLREQGVPPVAPIAEG